MKQKKFLEKFLVLGVIVVSVFLISSFLIYFIIPRVVDVHEIGRYPGAFKGSIGVVGEVVIKDDKSTYFMLLDCGGNACAAIPVKYDGQSPEKKSVVIAYGEIKEAEKGRYRFDHIFEAHEIKARNNDFSGNFLYLARKELKKSRKWLYRKCGECINLPRRLFYRG